jgi:hypothetical protein
MSEKVNLTADDFKAIGQFFERCLASFKEK